MAVAIEPSNGNTPGQNNKLLNAWQREMSEDIWHFNQCAGAGAPFLTSPDKGKNVYLQPEREMLARALEGAIGKMSDSLMFWPRPAYFQDIHILGNASPIQWQTFKTDFKKVIQLGQQKYTLIQPGVAVVYSDPQSYGVDTLATIQVTTTVDPTQVVCFFTATDSGYPAGDTRFEIEPLNATVSGGVVTLTGHRALFVKPAAKWFTPYILNNPNNNDPNFADTSSAIDFVTTVDVYQVSNDTTLAINILAGDGTVLQSFAGELIEPENGIIRMSNNFCNDVCWSQAPYKMSVNYQAGLPLVNGYMDSEMQSAIVGLANAQIDFEPTNMSSWTLVRFKRDSEPMVQRTSGQGYSLLRPGEVNNPFGLLAGEVKAWRVCSRRYIALGGKITQGWIR
jgi:hypothetical protein